MAPTDTIEEQTKVYLPTALVNLGIKAAVHSRYVPYALPRSEIVNDLPSKPTKVHKRA